MPTKTDNILQLPLSVVGRVDIGRLVREVEALENYLETNIIRDPSTTPKMPKTSRLLDDIIIQNKIDPFKETDRERLKQFLTSIKTEAPLLHISFSADPSPTFIQKLLAWLRHEIHPLVLLQVGLQPTIGAGCIVRTTNKQFDFSLRQSFMKHQDILMAKIREVTAPGAGTQPAVAVEPVQSNRQPEATVAKS